MDALQRATRAAESARSHAYNADAVNQQLRRRVDKLEADMQLLIHAVRQQGSRIIQLQAQLDAAMKVEEEE